MLKTAKLASVVLVMGLASACTTNGNVSSPLKLVGTDAGRVSDKERASFGQRIALADGGFTTRVQDLATYPVR